MSTSEIWLLARINERKQFIMHSVSSLNLSTSFHNLESEAWKYALLMHLPPLHKVITFVSDFISPPYPILILKSKEKCPISSILPLQVHRLLISTKRALSAIKFVIEMIRALLL